MPKPLTIDGREVHRSGVYVVTLQSDTKGKQLPFPRKPRGEKPATTIRLQRRIIHNLQHIIETLRESDRSQTNIINGLNAYKDDLEQEVHDIKAVYYKERDIYRDSARRLNFLEGYYAAHQETLLRARPSIVSHQSETDAGSGPRNQENIRTDQSGPEKDRQDARAARPPAGHREEIRSERHRNRQDPERDALENFEVGLAHDAEPKRRMFRVDPSDFDPLW